MCRFASHSAVVHGVLSALPCARTLTPGLTWITGAAGLAAAVVAAGAAVAIAATMAADSAPAPAVSAMVLALRMNQSPLVHEECGLPVAEVMMAPPAGIFKASRQVPRKNYAL